MALKNKNRSIRLSDELLDIIEQQVGENFTQKFERLVYNCYMLAPQKEAECQRLDDEIALRREQLAHARQQINQLTPLLSSIRRQLTSVDQYLSDYIEDEL